MAIEHLPGGSVMITGAASIDYYRLCVLRGALGLEIKGIRMSRGRTAYSVLRQEYGFKGSRVAVLARVDQMIATMRANPDVIQREQ